MFGGRVFSLAWNSPHRLSWPVSTEVLLSPSPEQNPQPAPPCRAFSHEFRGLNTRTHDAAISACRLLAYWVCTTTPGEPHYSPSKNKTIILLILTPCFSPQLLPYPPLNPSYPSPHPPYTPLTSLILFFKITHFYKISTWTD